jgi:opacity protein-like surface antigen
MIVSSASVFAAPQTDFEKGKSSVDIGAIRSELKTSDNTGSTSWDKKTNLDFGITTGLNDKIALQYKFQKLDSGEGELFGLTATADSKVHEFNVLYKLNPNAYAFLGLQRLSGDASSSGYNAKIVSTTVAQIGVTGVTKLADKLNGWGTAAVGNDNYSYEVGLGYALATNTDFNLFYRYKKFNDLEFDGLSNYDFDAKSKGIGASITFKF